MSKKIRVRQGWRCLDGQQIIIVLDGCTSTIVLYAAVRLEHLRCVVASCSSFRRVCVPYQLKLHLKIPPPMHSSFRISLQKSEVQPHSTTMHSSLGICPQKYEAKLVCLSPMHLERSCFRLELD